jgi:hypothetical protein
MPSIDNFNKYMINYPKDRFMNKKKVKDFLDVVTDYSSLSDNEIDKRGDTYYNAMYYYDKSQQLYNYGGREIGELMQEAYKKLFKYSVELRWINEEIIVYDGVIAKLAEYNPNFPYIKKSLRIIV